MDLAPTFKLYKIVGYIGSITSRDLNHLPQDSHYDVLTTTLKTGVVNIGEKLYISSAMIIEGSTVHALVLFNFPANGSMNPDVF